jgi:hypothetical protein
MTAMNVRRLAAIDMHGTRGTRRRKRLSLTEFAAGLAVMVALGTWLAVSGTSTGGRILGTWLAGAGLNYAPLTVHAITLSRPGVLKAELAGLDAGRELRRYSIFQLWILVPLCLLYLTVRNAARPRR